MPQLILFLCISFLVVSLATGNELPFVQEGEVEQNVTLGSEQRTLEGERPEGRTGFEGIVNRASCVLTLGLTELLADTCTQGFAGVFEDLKNVTVLGTFVEGMETFVTMLAKLVTFNVPGAPVEVRFVVGTTITGSVGYIVFRVVRGGG